MTEGNKGTSRHTRENLERFEIMMNKYRAPAMALALNILGNREDAEDACQDAFVSAYHNFESNTAPSNLRSWILTILYRRCLDILRRRKRSIRLVHKFQVEIPLNSPIPGDRRGSTHSPRGKLPLLQKLLPILTEKEKLVLSLWANDDYTFQEIAGILGCSQSTARVHLFRARRKIKALMEKGHDPLSTC